MYHTRVRWVAGRVLSEEIATAGETMAVVAVAFCADHEVIEQTHLVDPKPIGKGKKANRSNSSRHAHGERHNDCKCDGKAEGMAHWQTAKVVAPGKKSPSLNLT